MDCKGIFFCEDIHLFLWQTNIIILLKDILRSFLEYFKINKQSLFLKGEKTLAVSALLYILFLSCSFIAGWWFINDSIDYINNFLNIKYGIEDITPLNSFMIINLQVSIRAMVIIGVLSLFKYMLLLLGSPIIYVVMSNILHQKKSFHDFKQHFKLSLYISYFHGRWDIIYFVFAFFLAFIPIIGIGVALVFLILQAYYIGNILLLLMYRIQYPSAMSLVHIKFLSHQTTGFSIGIGLGFTILQFIFPIVGMYIAPIYMLVVGAIIVNKEMAKSYES